MKKYAILILIFAVSHVSAQYQYGWQSVDTVTSGDYDDHFPQVSHEALYTFGTNTATWIGFERWDGGMSSIAAVRYLPSQLEWDPNVYAISSPATGTIQRFPDVSTAFTTVMVDSVYRQRSFTVAAWQEKSDTTWNIYFSTLIGDSTNWTLPQPLTQDSLDNTDPKVRPLTDSSVVIIWRRDSTIQYSVISTNGASSPNLLATSNTDSTEFDLEARGFGSGNEFVWTEDGLNGNRFCIIGQFQIGDSMTVTPTDTIILDGDIENPEFVLSYSPTITFNLKRDGMYQAWIANSFSSPAWQPELASGDSTSDNFDVVSYTPPYVTSIQRGTKSVSQVPPGAFAVWERSVGGDTSLIFSEGFYNTDTISTVGGNRDPSITDSPRGYIGNQFIGFAVFESGRTGRSHIYARYFYFTLGAINEPSHPPAGFSLFQNYPNPFNPTTNIGFRIANIEFVSLKVYDVLGRLVRTLINKVEQPGSYSVTFDAGSLSSGVYFYRLQAGSHSASKKLLLLR